MIRLRLLAPCLVALPLFALAPALAQDDAGAQSPATVTTSTPEEEAAKEDFDPIIHELEFQQVRLADAVQFLREACPGFQAVILSPPNVAGGDLVLPDMILKNVPLSVTLDLISRALPQVAIETVPHAKGKVWMFQVDESAPAQPGTLVIHSLRPLIRTDKDGSEALNDILSLLEAALEAQGSAQPAVMKVHEATQTLILRGSNLQIEAIQQALDALAPSEEDVVQAGADLEHRLQMERMEGQIRVLEARLAETIAGAASARKLIGEQAQEIEMLQGRLKAAERKSP